MPGPAPKKNRVRRNEPVSGDWKIAPGAGWQHGPAPKAPTGLLKASKEAWEVWMGAWFAAFWVPEDLPGLRQVVRVYDQVERGDFTRAGELRLAMTAYGMNPEGQQKRHWMPARDELAEIRPLRAVVGGRMLAVDPDA
jgi:hypothetical protein